MMWEEVSRPPSSERQLCCISPWDPVKASEAPNLIFSTLGHVTQLGGALSHTPKCFGFDSWSGRVQEATDRCFSLTSMILSLSLPFSLKSINISLGED